MLDWGGGRTSGEYAGFGRPPHGEAYRRSVDFIHYNSIHMALVKVYS